jgi:high-affinity iron transporter
LHIRFAVMEFAMTGGIQLFHKILNILLTLLFVSTSNVFGAGPDEVRQLIQLTEYIGIDYQAAVNNGEIINGPEYLEMVEFSELIVSGISSHEELGNKPLLSISQALLAAVKLKVRPGEVRKLTSDLRTHLLEEAGGFEFPSSLLPRVKTTSLYEENCSQCHGGEGRGDGLLAKNLDPRPTDFTDVARARNRSLLGLHDAIRNGIDGTSMVAFKFSEEERWSLAFYVGSLAFNGSQEMPNHATPEVSLSSWIKFSPDSLLSNYPNLSEQKIGEFRHDSGPFFERADPIALTRSQLRASVKAYSKGNRVEANRLAISAYLDGFELIEGILDAQDSQLRRSIENDFMEFRRIVALPDAQEDLEGLLIKIFEKLDRSETQISQSLSDGTLFGISFVILLREGLEALLVVIALVTVLLRTDRRDALKYIHIGWVAALVAGAGTWVLAEYFVSISGGDREIIEGVAALVAALVLFYVGFWMHSKASAQQWQNFIQRRISQSLSAGTLWGLAGLAFISVYREVFETVCFISHC